MNNEDLLARIKLLEQENRVLQQIIDELQQEKQNQYPLLATPVSFQGSPMDYISSEFWMHPADFSNTKQAFHSKSFQNVPAHLGRFFCH